MKHLRWGLLAAGNIANRFARGLATTDQATAVAVGARDLERAKAFAEQHKLERAYGSYDELLADPEVDAVYISTMNDTHAEWSIKAARAGKHILCEKPVTMNARELEQVLEVVRAEGVFFMEAFMFRCHPQWKLVRELLDADTIGEVRVLEADFAFNMGPNSTSTRMHKGLGGGGLMDVGCYCVSFCQLIARAHASEAHAVAYINPATEVDEWASGCLKFPSGIVATFTCALRCGTHSEAVIFGDKGSIAIKSPWIPGDNAPVIVSAGGETVTHDVSAERDLYANEALAVAEHLEARQTPYVTWEDSLGHMRTLDTLRASMGLHWDCD